MKQTKLIRRIWVAFLAGTVFAALYLFLYLANETTVRSLMAGVAIAYGVMAVGAAIGVWLDVKVTRWIAERKMRTASAEPTN